MSRGWVLLPLLAAGCDAGVTATVVTVDARPAVHGVDSLEVTFGNGNATLAQRFDIDGRSFPLSFSVETPGRAGELEMTAEGRDVGGNLVALGTGRSTIIEGDVAQGRLTLDPTDFPVNTAVAGSQKLAWNDGAAGVQLAADPAGTFTIGFTDDCGALVRCDLWARRFDVAALPQATAITASDAQFNVNLTDVFGNDPALAVSSTGVMLAAWTTFNEILAVAITPEGAAAGTAETVVSTGATPGDPSVAALPDGRFVVVWTETDAVSSAVVIRARFLDDSGALTSNPESGSDAPFTVATGTAMAPPVSPSVIAGGTGHELGLVWRVGNSLRARFVDAAGNMVPNQEVTLASMPPFEDVWSPRIAATGTGRYVVGWSRKSFGGGLVDDGAIVVRQIAPPSGVQVGVDSLVARGLPDSTSRFSLAADGAGELVVSWHGCNAAGDASGCGVHAQMFRPTGLPVGERIEVNTTTEGDQTTPSITPLVPGAWAVAWTDDSRAAPDTAATGIRARIIYPTFDNASAVVGAVCGRAGDAACGDGLACMPGTDTGARCHRACTPSGPAPQCPDGGVCTTAGTTSGCLF